MHVRPNNLGGTYFRGARPVGSLWKEKEVGRVFGHRPTTHQVRRVTTQREKTKVVWLAVIRMQLSLSLS